MFRCILNPGPASDDIQLEESGSISTNHFNHWAIRSSLLSTILSDYLSPPTRWTLIAGFQSLASIITSLYCFEFLCTRTEGFCQDLNRMIRGWICVEPLLYLRASCHWFPYLLFLLFTFSQHQEQKKVFLSFIVLHQQYLFVKQYNKRFKFDTRISQQMGELFCMKILFFITHSFNFFKLFPGSKIK